MTFIGSPITPKSHDHRPLITRRLIPERKEQYARLVH